MNSKTIGRWSAPVLAVLAGFLMVLPIAWTPGWPLTFVGMAIFFWLVDDASGWLSAAWRGYLAGLSITAVGFYWLNYVVVVYGGVPLAGSLALFALFSLVFGMKMPFLSVLLYTSRKRRPDLALWTYPLAVVVADAAPLALFPFHLASFQTGNLPLLQMADIVGSVGIGYPIGLVGLLLYRLVRDRSVPRLWWGYGLSVLVLWYGYGFIRMHQVEALQAGSMKLRVALVQPNTPLRSSDPTMAFKVLENCRRLTLQVASMGPRPDLICWPEGGTPFAFDSRQYGADIYFHRVVTDLATQLHTQLLFNEDLFEEGKAYNAATLVDEQGRRVDHYKKMVLLAFGEYMPLADTFPVLRQFGIYDLTPGHTIKALALQNGAKVAPEICYEILFPGLTRQFVQKGAGVIVNLTDDAWFGPTLASYEHLHDLLCRAIENRRALVRCTNSGTSVMLDATGRFLTPPTPLYQEAVQVQDVPLLDIHTFYTAFGDVFAWACAAGLLVLLWRPSRN